VGYPTFPEVATAQCFGGSFGLSRLRIFGGRALHPAGSPGFYGRNVVSDGARKFAVRRAVATKALLVQKGSAYAKDPRGRLDVCPLLARGKGILRFPRDHADLF
jgi:hypothetical protein